MRTPEEMLDCILKIANQDFDIALYVDDVAPTLLLLDKDGTFPNIQIAEDYWYVKNCLIRWKC